MKKLSFTLVLAAALAFTAMPLALLPGCTTSRLELGGAYAPTVTNNDGTITPVARANIQFFAVDSAFDLAYSTIDAVFLFERNNRLYLWGLSPQVKHSLDAIRPQAVDVKRRYAQARNAYIVNPVAANLTLMQTVLGEARALAAAATAAMPATK